MVKRLPFRLYTQILLFSALVALGALLLLSLQRVVQRGIMGVRDGLITRLEKRIDRKIRYSSISPSLFGAFDVRNVRIMGVDERPVLSISRFRVAYSLFDLLRGKPQAIHSVQLDTPYVDFNTSRDHDLINLIESVQNGADGSAQDLSSVLSGKLLVRIRNGKCLINGSAEQLTLDILNLSAEIVDGRVVLDSRWNAGVTVHQLAGKPVSLRAAMQISGSCETDMEAGEAVVNILSVSGDAQSDIPASFALTLQNGVIAVQKTENQLPFNFSLVYGIEDGTIDTWLDCRDLQMGHYVSFSGALENVRQLLDITGSGTAYLVRRRDSTLAYSIDMAGAVPADTIPTQAGGAAFRIKASGDETQALIQNLHFSMPGSGDTQALFYGDLDFSGRVGLSPLAPAGLLSLHDFSLSGQESLNADITISSVQGTASAETASAAASAATGNEIRAFCESLTLGGLELNAFSALLQPSGTDVGFTVSVENTRAGSLTLEGSMNSESRRVEANVQMDAFLASDLAGMAVPFTRDALIPAPFTTFAGSTTITTEIFLTTDFNHLIYNTPRFVISGRMGKEFTGFASISGTDRHFVLNEGRVDWGGETLQLSGEADFANPENVTFTIEAGYRDLGYDIQGTVGGKSVKIQGPYGLSVDLAAGGGDAESGGYMGTILAEYFPVPFMGQPALLSLAARLRYDSAEAWSVHLERFEMTDITSPAGPAQVRISGSANQDGAVVPQLYFTDLLGPISGRADVSWTKDFSGFTGTLSMREGAESYRLNGSYADRHLDLSLLGSSMRLDRLMGKANNILADGTMALSWDSVDSFQADFRLSSLRGRFLEQDFSAEAAMVLNQEALSVNRLHMRYADLEGTISQFAVNGAEGRAGAEAALSGFAGKKPVNGRVSLTAAFTPMRSWFDIGEALRAFDGKIRVAGLRYGEGEQPQNFEFVFSRSEGALAASGGPRNMLRFRMDPEGNFYAGLSSPFPVRGTVIGSIKQNMINARCNDLYLDMGEVFNLLPEVKDIYLTGGYVNASIDIKGSVSDPEFFGTARGTSLRIRIPAYMPQELRPIPFTVVMDGNEMRFGPVSTAVGNGAGTVTGRFRFDRWIPNIFSIDIAVPRETPIPYGFEIIGFMARGDVSGKLNVSMENLAFDISGDLYGNNTELGINSEEIARSQEADPFAESEIPFAVNLTVTTGPVVEFFYPNSQFPILRANPSNGTVIRVSADSLTQKYSLNSDVKIRGGEIFYFEQSFYIRSGTLVFRENELRFEPRLTARAEVRDRTDEGPVTISMLVDNAPLLSFDARFESNPPLSQMEIYSLLGQNNINGNQFAESEPNSRAFTSTVDLLAQFLLGRQLEQLVSNFMPLDMFSIRTQLVQNALFIAAGQTPIDRTGRVGNYFDNTTIFGGKYIGEDMFVQGMLSLQYDANRVSSGGLTAQPDFGIELQNPLFSIRWDFTPTHPENWYVNDNSITLTRSWTF